MNVNACNSESEFTNEKDNSKSNMNTHDHIETKEHIDEIIGVFKYDLVFIQKKDVEHITRMGILPKLLEVPLPVNQKINSNYATHSKEHMSGSTSYQNKAKSDVNFESNLARIDVKATANDWIETSVSSPVSTEDSGNTRDYVINTIEAYYLLTTKPELPLTIVYDSTHNNVVNNSTLESSIEATESETKDQNVSLTAHDLFQEGCMRDTEFVSKVAVFIYFKSKGYYLRTGLNYGVHFTAYRGPPSTCHSEFCIQIIDEITTERCNASTTDVSGQNLYSPSWNHISALTRIMPDVQKVLLLCYVANAPGVNMSANADEEGRVRSIAQDRRANPSLSPIIELPGACGPRALQITPVFAWAPRQYATNEGFQSISDCHQSYLKKSEAHAAKLKARKAHKMAKNQAYIEKKRIKAATESIAASSVGNQE